MGQHSKIEWTETTWNPVTGCTKISIGCKNCYAERFAKRLQMMGLTHYSNSFNLTIHQDSLNKPYKWKHPRLVFVNSMSDLFHEDIPFEFIKQIFRVMNDCTQHQFQVLTKRSCRLKEMAPDLEWTSNIWIGVSVENQNFTFRIDDLRNVPASVRFLSIEPLLDRIEYLDLRNIDWIIVGGESGPKARPIKKEWVIVIRDICCKQNVPFFFNQWGGSNKKKTGGLLDNREWNEMPFHFQLPLFKSLEA